MRYVIIVLHRGKVLLLTLAVELKLLQLVPPVLVKDSEFKRCAFFSALTFQVGTFISRLRICKASGTTTTDSLVAGATLIRGLEDVLANHACEESFRIASLLFDHALHFDGYLLWT